MEPAFARIGLLPPPAAGTRVLACDGWTGAGRAANRTVALVVERVVGHVKRADVLPHRVLAPVGKGIEFHDAVRCVILLHLELGAGGGLLAALAGDPGFLAIECAIEWLDLADVAAALLELHAFVECVAAELRHVLSHSLRIGPEHA